MGSIVRYLNEIGELSRDSEQSLKISLRIYDLYYCFKELERKLETVTAQRDNAIEALLFIERNK